MTNDKNKPAAAAGGGGEQAAESWPPPGEAPYTVAIARRDLSELVGIAKVWVAAEVAASVDAMNELLTVIAESTVREAAAKAGKPIAAGVSFQLQAVAIRGHALEVDTDDQRRAVLNIMRANDARGVREYLRAIPADRRPRPPEAMN